MDGDVAQLLSSPGVPEAFTAASLTAGILTNLASETVKHYLGQLEGTDVGRRLQSTGLVRPDLDQRLQKIFKAAYEHYFENNPSHKISGLMVFWQDPAVLGVIGDHLQDGQPVNRELLQERLTVHLGDDAISRSFVQKLNLSSETVVDAFLTSYGRILSRKLEEPQMALLYALLQRSETVVGELRTTIQATAKQQTEQWGHMLQEGMKAAREARIEPSAVRGFPRGRNPHFTGRIDMLSKVEANLSLAQPTVLTQPLQGWEAWARRS